MKSFVEQPFVHGNLPRCHGKLEPIEDKIDRCSGCHFLPLMYQKVRYQKRIKYEMRERERPQHSMERE